MATALKPMKVARMSMPFQPAPPSTSHAASPTRAIAPAVKGARLLANSGQLSPSSMRSRFKPRAECQAQK